MKAVNPYCKNKKPIPTFPSLPKRFKFLGDASRAKNDLCLTSALQRALAGKKEAG